MIEVRLQGMGEEDRDADVVIARFPFVLGRRRDCDHALKNQCVSRRHCCFFLRGEEIWLQDLESTNGTYVNGKRLEVPQVLHEGDRIALDSYAFEITFALVTRK